MAAEGRGGGKAASNDRDSVAKGRMPRGNAKKKDDFERKEPRHADRGRQFSNLSLQLAGAILHRSAALTF